MSSRFQVRVTTDDALSKGDRDQYLALVAQGGEVSILSLAANVANAKTLVIVTDDGRICGTGALKRPQGSYRAKTRVKSGLDLAASDYPYELGYIFLAKDARQHRLSHAIVSEALSQRDGAGVFATVRTDNDPMRATLIRAGFGPAGETYSGTNKDTEIGVLLLPAC